MSHPVSGCRLDRRNPSWPTVITVVIAAATLVHVAGAATRVPLAARPACHADCDGDGVVAIDELVGCVAQALGALARPGCPGCDTDADGGVSIDELVAATNSAIAGCAAPTATPTATPLPIGSPDRGTPGRVTPPVPTPTPGAAGCVPGGALPCVQRAPATVGPCSAVALAGNEVTGTTVGGTNILGNGEELSCGNNGGGAGALERVYIFTPPAPGQYEISVQGDKFYPLLHLRRLSCQGPYIDCRADTSSDRQPTYTLTVGAPIEPVAIGVDGDGSTQKGMFKLSIRPLLPDLVVDAVTGNSIAKAGQQVGVSARVRNQGDVAAGPFRIDFFYATDATLEQQLGASVASCQLAGLAADAATDCAAPTGLTVPRIGAGDYVIAARVDAGNQVGETIESNNTRAIATSIEVAGARLEQQLYRAADGTAYQLVRVVPIDDTTPAERYRITQLAGSTNPVDVQSSNATTVLTLGLEIDYSLSVNATPLTALSSVRRTMRLRPNDAGRVRFDSIGGGRLELGAGSGVIEVCGKPSACGAAAALLSATSSSDGFPRACTSGQRYGFGVPGGGSPACSFPNKVAQVATQCEREPVDGIALAAGEAVVFLYDTELEPFSVGLGGFGINDDNSDDCGAGQIVDVTALSHDSSRQALLSFVEASRPTAALDGVRSVALSPDDSHVYAGGPQGLVTLSRDQTFGLLSFVETLPVSGQVRAVVVSPDSRHVYAAGTGGITSLSRNATTGRLTSIQSEPGFTTATSMAMPPDGLSLYAASANSFAIRQRNVASGQLTPATTNGTAGPTAFAVTNSRFFSYTIPFNPLDVFSARIGLANRNPQTGLLSSVTTPQSVEGRFVFDTRAMVAPADGGKVYVASNSAAGTPPGLRVFTVRLQPAFPTPTPGPFFTFLDATIGPNAEMVEGLVDVKSMALSSDERYLFIAADGTSEPLVSGATLVALDTAALGTLADIKRDGSGNVDGLAGAASVAVSADGRHVYVAGPGDDAIAVFAINRAAGSPTPTNTRTPTPTISPPPTPTPTIGAVDNDRCETADETFASIADVSLATQSPSDPVPTCGNGSRAHSVWYKTTLRNYEFFTRGSTYDTIVSIYTGSCTALTFVSCNDDELSQIRTSRVPGGGADATYYIMVTSFDGSGGELQLHSRPFVAPF
jgi:hypothetical protein